MPKKRKIASTANVANRYPNTSLSLPDERGGFKLIKGLRAYAEDTETSASEVVRTLLKKFLEKRGYYKP